MTNYIKVTKAGDWALPVTLGNDTLLCVQINKTQADKDNIKNIVKEYTDKGVNIYTYEGKGGKPVLLVERDKVIRRERTSKRALEVDRLATEKALEALLASGMTSKQAKQALGL